MKTIFSLLFVAFSLGAIAQTTQLTQDQLDTLKTSSEFQKYLGDKITAQVVYLLGLTSFASTDQARAFVYAESFLQPNPNYVYTLPTADFNSFFILRMRVRGLDYGLNSVHSSALEKLKAALAGGGFGYLVDDYFKSKTYKGL